MEEGLTRRPLLDHGASPKEDSAPTAVVVFSTLVALCGSLCAGCVVSPRALAPRSGTFSALKNLVTDMKNIFFFYIFFADWIFFAS